MEIDRHGEGYYSIESIGNDNLDAVYVDVSAGGSVWIDTYTKNHEDPEYYSARSTATTYGWIDPDTAEVIALAILEAVNKARRKD